MEILQNYLIPDLCNIVNDYLMPTKKQVDQKYFQVLQDLRFVVFYSYFECCQCFLCDTIDKPIYKISESDFIELRNNYIKRIDYKLENLPRLLWDHIPFLCKDCINTVPCIGSCAVLYSFPCFYNSKIMVTDLTISRRYILAL